MASITVRNLDDGLKRRLRIRAAENGRSMEEEARGDSENGARRRGCPSQEPRNGSPRTVQALRRGGAGDSAKGPDARSPTVSLSSRQCSFWTPASSSELMRDSPHSEVRAWLDAQPTSTLFVAAITEAEILNGHSDPARRGSAGADWPRRPNAPLACCLLNASCLSTAPQPKRTLS